MVTETLEEYQEALKQFPEYDQYLQRIGFESGAKWYKRISYSQEEVVELLEMLQKCKEYFLLKTDKYSDETSDAIGQVLEKFKKK